MIVEIIVFVALFLVLISASWLRLFFFNPEEDEFTFWDSISVAIGLSEHIAFAILLMNFLRGAI